MFARIKTRALWIAIGITLGGGALALAAPIDIPTNPPEVEVGDVDLPDAADAGETPRETPKAKDEAKERSEKARAAKVHDGGERKHNHGFFVSSAAHCEDVGEGETSFDAPSDCETNGEAHGEYVSSVAQSDLGKPEGAQD